MAAIAQTIICRRCETRRSAAAWQRDVAYRDAVGSVAGCPHLWHGAFYSGVASLRPVDATGHEKDVMRGEECGVKREAGNGL
jgi:hypothetical protein